ncbi:hypothetical protein [Erythrobacter tepidarius]|uniref:hypothetical protein n=1 Tax=Erythrobacter tepidarius TaxID=60454 RepID=UPI00117C4124|nr:hypothetical protein [Erythrobacter tepidarius]
MADDAIPLAGQDGIPSSRGRGQRIDVGTARCGELGQVLRQSFQPGAAVGRRLLAAITPARRVTGSPQNAALRATRDAERPRDHGFDRAGIEPRRCVGVGKIAVPERRIMVQRQRSAPPTDLSGNRR